MYIQIQSRAPQFLSEYYWIHKGEENKRYCSIIVVPTVSFTDLDQSREIIIFVSLLTTFEASFIFFVAAGTVAKMDQA